MPTVVSKKSGQRGRPKKADPLVQALVSEVEDLKEQLAAAVELVTNAGSRTVETRAKTVEVKADPIPLPPPPPPVKKGVIFHSRHRGFKQRIVPQQIVNKSNGEERIVPPVFIEFEQGIVRVTDTEHIELMREVKRDNDSRGLPTPWVEGVDEFGDIKPKEAIQSKDVTVDTPLKEVIS